MVLYRAILYPGNCSLWYEECREDSNIQYLLKKSLVYIYIYIYPHSRSEISALGKSTVIYYNLVPHVYKIYLFSAKH